MPSRKTKYSSPKAGISNAEETHSSALVRILLKGQVLPSISQMQEIIMSIICSLCRSSDLRFSRLRMKDLLHLLLLQYPMRCWVCREREYMPVMRVLTLGRR